MLSRCGMKGGSELKTVKCMKDDSGGSGPYKANYTVDASLPNHTIYAPKTRPPDSEKLPVIVWGNGACVAVGTMFYNFLNELASYGFLIIANGRPNGGGSGMQSNYRDLIKSIDWVTSNPAAKKYGNIDTSKIVAAGQSCGGLEAVSGQSCGGLGP
jgi:dipeptidyl aminopeptidase/acylaminoacyl peptidase